MTLSAGEVLGLVVDEGSFRPWDQGLVSWDPLGFTAEAGSYAERLASATERTGATDSIVTGRAAIEGHAVVLIVGEFGFLGGSIGVASGERIARAFDRAVELGLPVLAITASGGTRIQEGTPAFLQMVKAAGAVERFRATALPYVAYLQDPTMGGVLASWGSLAHLTWAAPGARLGFSGPRVVELVTGARFPGEVQRAEHLLGCGVLDEVFPIDQLRQRFSRVLSVTGRSPGPAVPPTPGGRRPLPRPGDAWRSVQHARDPLRPGARGLLDACATDITVLRGDRVGADDESCLTALANLGTRPAVVVAQTRTPTAPSRMGPAGYRKARRAMALAQELRLPVVTVIDSPGAELTAAAEEGGLSGEISRCIAALVTLRSPTVCVVLGEGGGGGALALFPADRVIFAQHAWLAPIAPEGASAILWRDADHAADLARAHGLASWELAGAGVVDRVVAEAEPPGRDPQGFLSELAETLMEELALACDTDEATRLGARADRYRRTWSPPP